jgi:hypothetical protein
MVATFGRAVSGFATVVASMSPSVREARTDHAPDNDDEDDGDQAGDNSLSDFL